MVIFDSRIVRRTVCESMPSRVQKLLQWVVALENQHAIRAVCKGTPTKTYWLYITVQTNRLQQLKYRDSCVEQVNNEISGLSSLRWRCAVRLCMSLENQHAIQFGTQVRKCLQFEWHFNSGRWRQGALYGPARPWQHFALGRLRPSQDSQAVGGSLLSRDP